VFLTGTFRILAWKERRVTISNREKETIIMDKIEIGGSLQ